MRTDSNGLAWTYLFIASILEVEWAIALKYAEGFTKLWPSIAAVIGMVLSVGFLALAVRTLPIGTAYAVWTGIGAALTALLGMFLFNEPRDALRLLCLLLIVGGVAGLKLLSPSH
jgi:quaternary ammonium compound-resistance protein SugE